MRIVILLRLIAKWTHFEMSRNKLNSFRNEFISLWGVTICLEWNHYSKNGVAFCRRICTSVRITDVTSFNAVVQVQQWTHFEMSRNKLNSFRNVFISLWGVTICLEWNHYSENGVAFCRRICTSVRITDVTSFNAVVQAQQCSWCECFSLHYVHLSRRHNIGQLNHLCLLN